MSLVYLYVFKNLQPNPSSNDTFNNATKTETHVENIDSNK